MQVLYDKDAGQAAIGFEQPQPCSGDLNRMQPTFYDVASNLRGVFHLSREQHLAIWRRVLDLYAQANQPVPPLLRDLCQDSFVNDLLENEVFWGMVGSEVSRDVYARATDHLSAVYATAALMAAKADNLPISPDDQSLLAGFKLSA